MTTTATVGRSIYVYNPGCDCDWCTRGGEVPTGTPSNGHSFGYDTPHIPPIQLRYVVPTR